MPGGGASVPSDARPSDLRPFAVVIWTFAALLLQSVLFALIAAVGGHGDFGITSQLTWISILEAVDTVIVFLAAMMLWNLASPRDSRRPLLAWARRWPAPAAARSLLIWATTAGSRGSASSPRICRSTSRIPA